MCASSGGMNSGIRTEEGEPIAVVIKSVLECQAVTVVSSPWLAGAADIWIARIELSKLHGKGSRHELSGVWVGAGLVNECAELRQPSS